MEKNGLAFGFLFCTFQASVSVFASDGTLVLLNGESATSAVKLSDLLVGDQVVTQGAIKSVTLDSNAQVVLRCNRELGECSITNPTFEQVLSTDYDRLMKVEGVAAETLFDVVQESHKTPSYLYVRLGTSGKFGSDILECKKSPSSSECRILRMYCYFPGC